MERQLKATVFESASLPRFRETAVSLFSSSVLPVSLDDPRFVVLPGFCDVHVHFREPGFSYKETIGSGSLAAAHGGYTTVCTMPNLSPVPDSLPHLEEQLGLIKEQAVIDVRPYGAITVGQLGETLSDMEAIAPHTVAFSDDGRGVQNAEMMQFAMCKAKALDRMIVAHCEDNSLLKGGYIHDGIYAADHGHRGICSESEWGPIKRDLALAEETECAYHVCHISCKESVSLIREAKKRGVNVTCETAPHYLLLTENHLQEDGRFKMNPPLRSEEDCLALIEGVLDGTVDIIATDHAPHSEEEKSRGLMGSPFGIVGLETAFPLMYTHFVKKGILSLENLMDLMVIRPRERFNLPPNGLSVWDLNETYEIDPADFLSKGKSTPFTGSTVCGKCLATVCNGKLVYLDKSVTR